MIAYLLLCHNKFDQLNLLINALNDFDSDFYIHVDLKSGSYPVIDKPNVIYLKHDNRVAIQWSSYEMVQATINLIETCLKSKKPYDYIVLLSGQDFPIKRKEEIKKILSADNDSNYIDVLDDEDYYCKRFKKRNDLYYPKWMQRRTAISKCIKRLYIYATGGYEHTFKPFRKKNPTGVRYYFGSQWWALRRECVKWMIDYINTYPEYLTVFKSSITPDESFFQTLFLASPYAESKRDKLVYLEWEGIHPKVIDKDTAVKLITKDGYHLFARKFDIETNKDALEYVISQIS